MYEWGLYLKYVIMIGYICILNKKMKIKMNGRIAMGEYNNKLICIYNYSEKCNMRRRI
jgi:hypothetical protein